MQHQSIFDLCLNASENIFLALSKNRSIINANQIIEEVLDCKKCEVIGKNIDIFFKKKFLCDFPKILSSTKKTKITTTCLDEITSEKVIIVWDIIPLPGALIEDEIAFWMVGKVGNSLTSKQREELKFHNLVKYAPGLFYWKDKESVYQGCNDEFAKLAGLKSRFEVEGKTDYDLPWKDKADDYTKIDREVISTGMPNLNHEETVKTVGEKTRSMITNKVPLLNSDNKIIGVLGITTDITHQKNIEEEVKIINKKLALESRYKSEFIANMSHDIRTPITGIIGLVQDLHNTAQDTNAALKTNEKLSENDRSTLVDALITRVENNSDVLIGSVDELLQLCNEILEVTRLEKGVLAEKAESFDIHQLMQHNLGLLMPTAQHRKLNLTVDVAKTVPQYLNGLRIYLTRTLLNLMSNALKFTDAGFVKVSIRLLEGANTIYQKGDQVTLKITVEDSGIGIPEENYKIIFEHFSRLNPSYEGVYKGFGLGLYTVKQYIEAMNGTIEVSSEVGKGTSFLITVPFTVSDHSDRTPESIRPSHTMSKLSKMPSMADYLNASISSEPASCSILLVEDNGLAAMALSLTLKELGCAIDVAGNGTQAIEKAKNGVYDLIFMDIGLPDMTGIDVTKTIRAFPDKQKAQVPIVAVTGHAGDAEKRQECLDAGMQDVLNKPAQPLLLESVLERFVFHNIDGKAPDDKSEIPTENEPNLPIIDWEASVHMCGGNADTVRHMLSLLTEELKATKNIFAKCYPAKDVKALREELHRSIGGVVYLRLPQLEHTLKAFQAAVKTEPPDWNECDRCYVDLQEAIEAFRSGYGNGEF